MEGENNFRRASKFFGQKGPSAMMAEDFPEERREKEPFRCLYFDWFPCEWEGCSDLCERVHVLKRFFREMHAEQPPAPLLGAYPVPLAPCRDRVEFIRVSRALSRAATSLRPAPGL